MSDVYGTTFCTESTRAGNTHDGRRQPLSVLDSPCPLPRAALSRIKFPSAADVLTPECLREILCSHSCFCLPPVTVIPPQDSKEVITRELIHGGQIGESEIYSENYKKWPMWLEPLWNKAATSYWGSVVSLGRGAPPFDIVHCSRTNSSTSPGGPGCSARCTGKKLIPPVLKHT